MSEILNNTGERVVETTTGLGAKVANYGKEVIMPKVMENKVVIGATAVAAGVGIAVINRKRIASAATGCYNKAKTGLTNVKAKVLKKDKKPEALETIAVETKKN